MLTGRAIYGPNDRAVNTPSPRGKKKMIPAKTFCAALQFVRVASAVKDVRYHLKGVFLEFKAPNSLHLVATDGHRMHVIELQVDEHEIDASFLIASEDVEKMLALYKKAAGTVTFYPAEKGALGTVSGDSLATFPVIDGKFPEWRLVVPAGDLAGAPGHWHPGYVADAMRAVLGLQKGQKLPCAKQTPIAANHSATLRIDAARTDYPLVRSAFAIVMGIKE